MKALRNLLDKAKPTFTKGSGKLGMFQSVFEGVETFLFVPSHTSKSGTHIHDSVDSKRTMTMVIIALVPALLFGMYNTGYQHFLAIGQEACFWSTFLYGFLAVLPKIVVAYGVGLGIEFAVAQFKNEEIHEGFLVSGILIPMIVPVDLPLWMLAVATAFAVIFAKEVFGGTGRNIFNVALVTRAFLFFAYPGKMSGDGVWVRTTDTFSLGGGTLVDTFSGATPLGEVAIAESPSIVLKDIIGNPITLWDMFLGLIPGSIGETSKLAILLGAILMIFVGVASWRTMIAVFAGGALTGLMFNAIGSTPAMSFPWYSHLLLGGFAFGAVFMATDPVTSARTRCGKWYYGFLIGMMAIVIRVLNPGYPEGMMMAILLLNCFAPLIDYVVVNGNIKKRAKRSEVKS